MRKWLGSSIWTSLSSNSATLRTSTVAWYKAVDSVANTSHLTHWCHSTSADVIIQILNSKYQTCLIIVGAGVKWLTLSSLHLVSDHLRLSYKKWNKSPFSSSFGTFLLVPESVWHILHHIDAPETIWINSEHHVYMCSKPKLVSLKINLTKIDYTEVKIRRGFI